MGWLLGRFCLYLEVEEELEDSGGMGSDVGEGLGYEMSDFE